MGKKLTELLAESEQPFYAACKAAEQLEKDFERCLSYLNYLGIDPMDGSPTAKTIVGMRIQELKREVGKANGETDAVKKQLYDLKLSLHKLAYPVGEEEVFQNMGVKVKIECIHELLVPKPSAEAPQYYKCHACNHVQGYR